MKKFALAAICFAGLTGGLMTNAAQAQVVIRVAPPAPIVEHYGPRPASRLRMGWRLSSLGRRSLCLDAGILGCSATPARRLGSRSL